MMFFAVPTSLLAYYGSRVGYSALNDSAWSVRFLGFGLSYLVFPVLTWLLLGETMFTLKTGLCIFLSFTIISIQVWM
jgi:hypothetical protein